MQKALLVTNKATQVREYLEHRSIIEITEEHRGLNELDLEHLGIIDVDKFLYIYYGSDDGDLAFRSDLSILRQLLKSAFFHASEGIFILVDCKNAMLEDLIHSACRDSVFVGSKLEIIHHKGVLNFSDVSMYISGTVIGAETTSSYKAVYVREEDSEEHERFINDATGLDSVLPQLTDQYTMYKRRASVEAVGSARMVTETYTRPQILQNFAKHDHPTIRQWTAFLISGQEYSSFENSVYYLLDYYERVGFRCMVVDLTDTASVQLVINGCHTLSLNEIAMHTQFAERCGYLKCRFNQMGYVAEMLDNIGGINVYLFVCDKFDYNGLQYFLDPLCENLYCNFVTHFTEDAVQDYLKVQNKSTTLFLSQAVLYRPFNLKAYKDAFEGTRVAQFSLTDVDTTDFYECATGGGL